MNVRNPVKTNIFTISSLFLFVQLQEQLRFQVWTESAAVPFLSFDFEGEQTARNWNAWGSRTFAGSRSWGGAPRSSRILNKLGNCENIRHERQKLFFPPRKSHSPFLFILEITSPFLRLKDIIIELKFVFVLQYFRQSADLIFSTFRDNLSEI